MENLLFQFGIGETFQRKEALWKGRDHLGSLSRSILDYHRETEVFLEPVGCASWIWGEYISYG